MSIIVNTWNGTLDDGEFPPIVYKYRFWDDPYHRRFITEKEVFMASPSSFEDILDCKIPVRYDLLNEKQIMQWGMRLSKIENPQYNRNQHRYETKEWMKEKKFKNKELMNDFRDFYFDSYDKRMGVLSLTAQPCLEDMWEKYANYSQGFCVGYNSRIMFENLGGGGKVSYYDELPVVLPEPAMTHLEMRTLQTFSKLRKWEFESEYRTHTFFPFDAEISDRQVKLPKEAFCSIILGANISNKSRIEIIEAVKTFLGNIPIFEQNDFCSSINCFDNQ